MQARAVGAHPVRTVATLPPDRGWVEQTLQPPVCPISNSVPKHPDCQPRFCPETSGAIHYFALRAAQRRLFLLVTGCSVCGGDAKLPAMEDFGERLVLASRYGSHVWVAPDPESAT